MSADVKEMTAVCFWGRAGGKTGVGSCQCRTIIAAPAKTLLSEAEKHVCGSDSLLFKDTSLTLVLGLAPLEQVSTLTHCSSAL